MRRKRNTAEQIIEKLREAEVDLAFAAAYPALTRQSVDCVSD
jgi:uncharacterized protein (DUF433 family)